MALDLDRGYFNDLCEFLEFKPHKAQIEVIDAFFSGERFLGIDAGRRWGKSKLAAAFFVYGLGQQDKKLWLMAPTYDLCGKIWFYLVPWVIKAYGKATHVKRSSPAKIVMDWDTILEAKSTDHPDSCIGEGLDLIGFDEAATEKGGRLLWQQQVRSTLIDRMGQAIFPSTPRGQGWLPEMLETEGAWHKRFPSMTNPHLSRDELEKIKKTMDPMVYRQEILAEIVTFAGMVYSMFNGDTHVITKAQADEMTRDWSTVIVVDPGMAKATCIQVIKHSRVFDQDVIVKDYQAAGMLFEDVYRKVMELAPPEGCEAYICDIAGKQKSQETGRSFVGWMRDQGIRFQHTGLRGVIEGVNVVRGRLLNILGETRLWVSEEATNTVKGFSNYHFKDNKHGTTNEEPEKDDVHDHSMDCARYYVTWRHRGVSRAVKH